MSKSRSNPSNGNTTESPTLTQDERERMIAEAAYYRALERGFQGGDPLDDWLQAERDIGNRMPSAPSSP